MPSARAGLLPSPGNMTIRAPVQISLRLIGGIMAVILLARAPAHGGSVETGTPRPAAGLRLAESIVDPCHELIDFPAASDRLLPAMRARRRQTHGLLCGD
jgi:hypothetical protein